MARMLHRDVATDVFTHSFDIWTLVAACSLGLSLVCSLIILGDIVRGRRQRMWIMNLVWPITGLWAGLLGLVAYFKYGIQSSKRDAHQPRDPNGGDGTPQRSQPFAAIVAKGTTHCGAGCTLGDISAELLGVAFPLTLFGRPIFGAWAYDFVLALAFGVAFQYFTIKPIRGLSRVDGVKEAIKADVLSLVAWQVGMYGWMAIARFVLFRHELTKTSLSFWFMMQIAMVLGFVTAYPVNWWLIRRGIKERM